MALRTSRYSFHTPYRAMTANAARAREVGERKRSGYEDEDQYPAPGPLRQGGNPSAASAGRADLDPPPPSTRRGWRSPRYPRWCRESCGTIHGSMVDFAGIIEHRRRAVVAGRNADAVPPTEFPTIRSQLGDEVLGPDHG